MRTATSRRASSAWILLVAFAVVAAGLAVGGWIFSSAQSRRLVESEQRKLEAVADLKVREIGLWRDERRADARIFSQAPSLAVALRADGSADPARAPIVDFVAQWFQAIRRSSAYRAVFLIARDGRVLPVSSADEPAAEDVARLAAEAIQSGHEVLGDLRAGDNSPYLDSAAPIRSGGENLGALVLRSDASRVLLPAIQTWPTPSDSAETLVVRRDGDHVVFLNTLRHARNAPLQFTLPIASASLPAAAAVRGHEGIFEGIDYRGIPVVAALRRVPGSDWAVVAKLDRDEVLERTRDQAWSAVAVTVASLLLAGAGIVVWARQRRVVELRERYAAEVERHALERHFAYLVRNAWDLILLLDRDRRVVEANDRALAAYGYSRDDLLGQPFDLVEPEAPAHVGSAAAGDGTVYEARHRRRDGTLFDVEVSLRAMDVDGQPFFQCIARDISERKRAQYELASREQSLSTTLQSIGDAVIATDEVGNIVRVNPVAEQLTGWPFADARGRPLDEVFHIVSEETGEKRESPVGRVLREGVVVGLANHTALIARDGTRRPIADSGAPIRTPGGPITGVVLVFRDASEERFLDEARNFRAHLLDAMDEAVVVTDADLNVRVWNPAAARLWRRSAEQSIGKNLLDILPDLQADSDPQALAAAVREHGQFNQELVFRDDDGRRYWVDVRTSAVRGWGERAVGFVCLGRDVTERQHMRTQLMLADRLASVGTLAAGVAHEINNPLSYAMSDLSFAESELRERVDRGDTSLREVLEALHEALDGAERVRRIVRDLRAFSRPTPEEKPTLVDLRKVLETAITLATNEIRHRARLEVTLDALPSVIADEAALGHALLNVLVNACQAIPEGHTDEHSVSIRASTDGAGRAVIEIRDSGRGIPPENLSRIFDPFFTTRPVGEGPGLGLSVTHGIVSRLGGSIEVESEPGRGSLFRVVLPPSSIAGQASPEPQREPPRASAPNARVLVVDDEPLVLRTVRRIVGTSVDVAMTAGEALARLAKGQRYALILCDVMMPQMDGFEFYERVEQAYPELAGRVVLMTGGAFTARAQEQFERSPARRLDKPFTAEQLRDLVAEFTAGPPAQGRPS